jgi:hypothetical protein
VRAEIVDEGLGYVPVLASRSDRVGGRGLHLVERRARRRGVFEGSTHQWFELALPRARRPERPTAAFVFSVADPPAADGPAPPSYAPAANGSSVRTAGAARTAK